MIDPLTILLLIVALFLVLYLGGMRLFQTCEELDHDRPVSS